MYVCTLLRSNALVRGHRQWLPKKQNLGLLEDIVPNVEFQETCDHQFACQNLEAIQSRQSRGARHPHLRLVKENKSAMSARRKLTDAMCCVMTLVDHLELRAAPLTTFNRLRAEVLRCVEARTSWMLRSLMPRKKNELRELVDTLTISSGDTVYW